MAEQEGQGRETMLLRFVLYSIIAWLVIGFIKKLLRGVQQKPAAAGRQAAPPPRPVATAALMVRCAACGTFIAESRAIIISGDGFCSQSCASGASHNA